MEGKKNAVRCLRWHKMSELNLGNQIWVTSMSMPSIIRYLSDTQPLFYSCHGDMLHLKHAEFSLVATFHQDTTSWCPIRSWKKFFRLYFDWLSLVFLIENKTIASFYNSDYMKYRKIYLSDHCKDRKGKYTVMVPVSIHLIPLVCSQLSDCRACVSPNPLQREREREGGGGVINVI